MNQTPFIFQSRRFDKRHRPFPYSRPTTRVTPCRLSAAASISPALINRVSTCAACPPHPRGLVDVLTAKRADVNGDHSIPQVAVWRKVTRRPSHYSRMLRQVDSICDDGCGRVRHRRSSRQNGDCIRDAQRKTPAAPSTCGDTAHRLWAINRQSSEERWLLATINHANPKALSSSHMQSDVATVIDVSARQFTRRGHARKNFFRNRARHCCHRGNEETFASREALRETCAVQPFPTVLSKRSQLAFSTTIIRRRVHPARFQRT